MHRGPLLLGPVAPLLAQANGPADYAGLRWCDIGPFRGGRTVAAAGIAAQPNVFYIGRVEDRRLCRTWQPLFDDQPCRSRSGGKTRETALK